MKRCTKARLQRKPVLSRRLWFENAHFIVTAGAGMQVSLFWSFWTFLVLFVCGSPAASSLNDRYYVTTRPSYTSMSVRSDKVDFFTRKKSSINMLIYLSWNSLRRIIIEPSEFFFSHRSVSENWPGSLYRSLKINRSVTEARKITRSHSAQRTVVFTLSGNVVYNSFKLYLIIYSWDFSQLTIIV